MNNISNEVWSLNISSDLLVEEEEVLRRLETVVPILVPIIFSIIILIGGVGNILVVLVVMINKNMRSTTNLLILNLAVSAEFLLEMFLKSRHVLFKMKRVCVVCTKKAFKVYPNSHESKMSRQVADILFIVFCIPFTAADYYLTSAWPFGQTWCKVGNFEKNTEKNHFA